MARVFEPSDWITLMATPSPAVPPVHAEAPQASAEVSNGDLRWKLLAATLKSLSVEPHGVPTPSTLQILDGLKVVSWDEVTLEENYVIVTFDSSGGRRRQDQSLLTFLWLRPLKVMSFVPVGLFWDVAVRTCSIPQPTPKSEWVVDQNLILKKVSGDVVVARGWLLKAWEDSWAAPSSPPVVPPGAPPIPDAVPFDGRVPSPLVAPELEIPPPHLPPTADDSSNSKRLRHSEFVPGKYQAIDLDSRVWHISESIGQGAILKVQFLIRCWPVKTVLDLLPGLKWSMESFWDAIMQRANLISHQSTTVIIDMVGPQFHQFTELVDYPLVLKVNETALEAFLLGNVFLLKEHIVNLNSFAPDVSVAQSEWSDVCSPADRVKIASCILGWSKFMNVFITSGLEQTVAVLINDLKSFHSSCRFITSFVIASEVWFLIASFMLDIKTKHSVPVGGSELVLSSDGVLSVVLADRIAKFIAKARLNLPDFEYQHYQRSIAPFQRKEITSQRPVVSPAELAVKKQLKKEAAEKQRLLKEKKDKAAVNRSSSSSGAEDNFCRFDILRLLGLKSHNTGKVFECTLDSCSHVHYNKLDDVPKNILLKIKDNKRSGKDMKEAISKQLLNLN